MNNTQLSLLVRIGAFNVCENNMAIGARVRFIPMSKDSNFFPPIMNFFSNVIYSTMMFTYFC